VQDDGLGNLTTFKVPVSSVGTDTNFANTDLTLTANRTHDLNGYLLTLNGTTNGMVVSTASTTRSLYGQNEGTGIGVLGVADSQSGVRGESESGAGVSGQSTSSYGGSFNGVSGSLNQGTTYGGVLIGGTAGAYMYSNSNGYGAIPYENSGSAGAMNCQGKALFDGTAATGSALVQVDSTTQGVLLPRMTTTERNAISSPATGLEIYNTTTARKEVYNGSFWRGISMRLMPIFHGQFNPTDAQTVAFGQSINAPTVSTNAYYEIIMRGAGVIRGCDLNMQVGGTLGTNENWSLYVRHNGTDYLVQTISSTTVVRNFNNASLNIPYVDGDIVRMIYVNPTWATNPTAVTATGNLILL
jgi:hypothetical protein